MLKQVPKKKPATKATISEASESASAQPYTRAELRKKNTQYVMRKEREKLAERQRFSDAGDHARAPIIGISAGALSYLATLGGACIASPFIKLAGALIAVGSAIYLISKYFT